MKSYVFLTLIIHICFVPAETLDCFIESLAEVNGSCTTVYGDIMITDTVGLTFAQLCEKLSNVKQVFGRVHFLRTPYQNFSFLSSLESVHYVPQADFNYWCMSRRNYFSIATKTFTDFQQTIRIDSNELLEDLGMPNLTRITMDALVDDIWFYV
ncbi:hypothetical protein CAEBREN_12076 [Caenorhabditis brenneri]|uniref:Receptor L-domain domain-containing protein n=1 Tax=Caenorhabditis brenneri TaxID=135651 RepID=G0MWG8_CAEBE|nr:hypothetical protein CAEBREN_12076 [Caenorhabditis brenneri]